MTCPFRTTSPMANGMVSHNTIGLMMDCDTTGIEPELALVKFKKLVGGGSMKIVNQTVPRALKNLGYQPEQVEAITEYIAEHGHIVSAPACGRSTTRCSTARWASAAICSDGTRPDDCLPCSRMLGIGEQDGEHAGDRDGRGRGGNLLPGLEDGPEGAGHLPRQLQGRPAAVQRAKQARQQHSRLPPRHSLVAAPGPGEVRPVRRRLPRQRPAMVTRFSVAGAEGYMAASIYPGRRATRARSSSSSASRALRLHGVMDAFSIAISVGLQYGIPLESYVQKFTDVRFKAQAGLTDDADIRIASSVIDSSSGAWRSTTCPTSSAPSSASCPRRSAPPSWPGQDPAALAEEVDPMELAQSAARVEAPHPERDVVSPPGTTQPSSRRGVSGRGGSTPRPAEPHSTQPS